jgi:predicted dehydrogenase
VDQTSRRSLTVGLVGCGSWGKLILRDLVTLGVRVVVALPTDRNRQIALSAGADLIVGDVSDLPDVDGVVVASPTTTHAIVVEALLSRDVPIYVEKPLCDDPDVASRLAAAMPNKLFVMHKWRYHPGIEALAAVASSGELGKVIGLRCTRVGWGNAHRDVDGVWLLAPHDLSIALEILGHLPAPLSSVAEHVDGTATGLIALLGDDPWLAIEVSTASPVERREVRLIGSEGVAMLADSYADRIVITRGSAHRPDQRHDEFRAISMEMPLLRELSAFVGHLAGGPPPKSSAADAAREVACIAELRRLAGLPRPSVIGDPVL